MPIVITLFGAFVVAKTFMNLYSTIADAELYCFHLDKEMNNGIPMHAPKTLSDVVEKNSQK